MIDVARKPEAEPSRVAPHNLEAEQALLGAILLNNDAYDKVSDFILRDHFYDPVHRRIYEVLSEKIGSGRLADWKTLKAEFENTEPIDGKTTAVQYLGKLASNATTIVYAREYGRAIYDLACRRQLILIGEDMVKAAYDAPIEFPAREQIEEAEQRLFALAEHGNRGQEVGFSAAVSATAESVRHAHHGGSVGLRTKLTDLDGKTGGLHATDLIILAGRPSMGKSGLATTIAYNVAKEGIPVGFYSLEMSKEQVANRIICSAAEIPVDRSMRGELSDQELRRFEDTRARVSALPIVIDETGGISIAQLAIRARKLKRTKSLGLIIIDYVQLMISTSKRNDSRVQEVTEITKGLKALAKELHLPILALSQLNRDVEKREDKRPQLADLRDSGSIEQDADIVLFVYRDEYYHRLHEPDRAKDTRKHVEWKAELARIAGKAEIIIGKQRHGAIGRLYLYYHAPTISFSDLAHDKSALGQ
jgi:replicative DNA helicase